MKARIILALTILLLSLSSLLVLWQVHAVPSNQGQQLFFDDFSSSQLSPNWNIGCIPVCMSNANLTQTGGWMGTTVQRSLLNGPSPSNGGITMTANNTDPIISSSTKTQFVYMVWRIIPFNLTQVGNNVGANNIVRNAESVFGLFGTKCSGSGSFCINRGFGIGFQLVETDSTTSAMMLGSQKQRETVGLMILSPMGNATTTNCYYGNGGAPPVNYMAGENWGAGGGNCTGSNSPAIVYSNPNAPFDLNTPHIFTMEAYFDSVNHNSWAAFNVDQNGWFNITQTACGCIDRTATGGSYLSLYPYFSTDYCSGITSGTCQAAVPSQSLATQIDYVLVDNYVPSSLPASSSIPNPGISGQIGPQGLRSTFPNYLVALSYELGKGIPLGSSQFLMSQVQFGGFLLFLITIMVITIPGVILHVRNPMIYSFLAFIISIIYFGLGVLALWFFGSIVLLFLGIMVGTVPASLRHTGGGGEVE